jgi:starch-binding outer membrane protein, SusD/RagB family
MKITKYILSLVLILTLALSSCKKDFLDLKPSDSIDSETALKDSAKLESFITGMYDLSDYAYFMGHIIMSSDVRGGDVIVRNYSNYGRFVPDYQFNIVVTYYMPDYVYLYGYKLITAANLIINAVPESSFGDAYKNSVIAEARALRSMAYYYMSKFFCQPYSVNPSGMGLPMLEKAVGPDEEFPARGTVQQLYDFMVADFEFAKLNIGNRNNGKAYYMNSLAVKGFLARIYLEMGNWSNAQLNAAAAHQGLGLQAGLNLDGFGKANSEWIFGLNHTADDNNGYLLVSSFYEPTDDGYSSFKASHQFYDLYEATDTRLDWFGALEMPANAYKVTKFEWPGTSKWALDQVLMRRAEMYLIEAEALAEQDLLDDALVPLNIVQVRSNATPTITGHTKSELIQLILEERRKELFGEGFASYDLQRRNLPLNRTSAGHWAPLTLPANDSKFLYPIPKREIDSNPQIVQNDGY